MQDKKYSDFIISGLKKKVISEQFACSDVKSVMKSYQENGRFSLKGKQFFRKASDSQFVMHCNT